MGCTRRELCVALYANPRQWVRQIAQVHQCDAEKIVAFYRSLSDVGLAIEVDTKNGVWQPNLEKADSAGALMWLAEDAGLDLERPL